MNCFGYLIVSENSFSKIIKGQKQVNCMTALELSSAVIFLLFLLLPKLPFDYILSVSSLKSEYLEFQLLHFEIIFSHLHNNHRQSQLWDKNNAYYCKAQHTHLSYLVLIMFIICSLINYVRLFVRILSNCNTIWLSYIEISLLDYPKTPSAPT